MSAHPVFHDRMDGDPNLNTIRYGRDPSTRLVQPHSCDNGWLYNTLPNGRRAQYPCLHCRRPNGSVLPFGFIDGRQVRLEHDLTRHDNAEGKVPKLGSDRRRVRDYIEACGRVSAADLRVAFPMMPDPRSTARKMVGDGMLVRHEDGTMSVPR